MISSSSSFFQVSQDKDDKVYKYGFSILDLCGNTLENQKEDGMLNGVIKEIEKYSQSVEQFISGNSTMENFQKDLKFIILTLTKLMTELKISSLFQDMNIDYYMEEKEKTIRLLEGLNTENAKDAENINLLIIFKNELLELIKDIVKIAQEKNLENGERKIGNIGTHIIEDIEKNNSRFFYCAKASKSERNLGMESFINMEVFKLICDEKNKEKGLIKEERLTHLLVDMDTLPKKDIEESILTGDLGWSKMLFGKNIMEKYQKDFMSIIKMKTNSTILLRTWNWLMHLLIKEYTLDANSLKENGGNHAEDVEKSKELIITINEKLALALGVKDVMSGMQLKIKLKEGKNLHPTVKSLKILEYLIKLVTKPGAIILDPFTGSGSTLIACYKTGRIPVGIEKEPDYVKIANARIKPFLEQTNLKDILNNQK